MTRGVAALAALAAAAVACAPSHRPARATDDPGSLVGVYRATVDDGAKVRHARVALWAMRPDRLHAELIAPVGGVRLVLDAGGGQACVVDVAGKTAFTGASGPEALEPIVGVRASVADAVAALLDGVSPPGLTVTRDGDPGSLPAAIRLSDGARSVRLERVRLDSRDPSGAALGTGRPPEGVAVRPLAELDVAPDEE